MKVTPILYVVCMRARLEYTEKTAVLVLLLIGCCQVLSAFIIGDGWIGSALFVATFTGLAVLVFLGIKAEDITLGFIFVNMLLGPFIFGALKIDGFEFLFQLDNYLGIVLLLYLIYAGIYKVQILLLCGSLALSSLVQLYLGHQPLMAALHDLLLVLSIVGIAGFVAWHRVESPLILKAMITAFAVHILISFVQFFVPITLRGNELATIAGFNRPVGLLEWSYTYGITTITLLWIILRALERYPPYLLHFFAIFSSISTRSVILGYGVWLLLRKNFYLSVLLILGLVVFLVVNYQLIDQSNQTKLLLAGVILLSYSDGSLIQQLFGYGAESASDVVNTPFFQILLSATELSYDNRIDTQDSFPAHNVFMQILYERGIIAFLVMGGMFLRHLRKYSLSSQDLALYFTSVVALNYLLHNGFYTFIFFLLFFPIREFDQE